MAIETKRDRRRRFHVAAALFAGAAIFQLGLQWLCSPAAREGVYYQYFTSEMMMQTLPIEDLRDAPLTSLWNLHIQPPALDVIRAVLARVWSSSDTAAMLRHIDRSLYVLWALLYAALPAIAFVWLDRRTRNVSFAIGAAVVLALHPACIFYATFLDTTLLTSVLVLLAVYAVGRLHADPRRAAILPMTLVVIGLFLTRSIFQWFSVAVFVASLCLLRVPRRRVAVFAAATLAFTLAYAAKQHRQFGLNATTSFAGLNLCNSIGDRIRYADFISGAQSDELAGRPSVLSRLRKSNGQPNFNNWHYLRVNRDLVARFETRIHGMSVGELAAVYARNLAIFFRPSSRHTAHAIVDQLPWRRVFDVVFSAPVLPILLVGAFASWVVRTRGRRMAEGLAYALPVLYVAGVSLLGEQGENMRFKFFIEPVLFVWLAFEVYAIVQWIHTRARPASTVTPPSAT